MQTYTQDAVAKVRRELLWLGCKHNEIEVSRHRTSLKLAYDNHELIAKPFEILATLKSIKKPVQVIDVWAILCLSQQGKLKKSNRRLKLSLLASLFCLILLATCMMIFEKVI